MQFEQGAEWQRSLIAALWKSPKDFALNADLLKPSHFTDEITGAAMASLLIHQKKHGTLPDLGEAIEQSKEFVPPGRTHKELDREVRRIWRRRKSVETRLYSERSVEFARREAVRKELERAALGGDDVDHSISRILEAARTGKNANETSYDYFEKTLERAKMYRSRQDKVDTVGTGIEPLDEAMKGGLEPGELGLIEALPNHGKSTLLTSIGANAVLSGRRVFHLTMENSRKLTAAKYDAHFFGTMDRIKKKPKSFMKKINSIREKVGSHLEIAFFPSGTLSVSSLMPILMDSEKKWDLVIVDYADEFAFSRRYREKWEELDEVYRQLKGLAGEAGTRIWTASQANRPGFQAQTLGMEHLAGSSGKAARPDVIISINWMESPGEVRLHLAKNRKGARSFDVEVYVDWERCILRDVHEE